MADQSQAKHINAIVLAPQENELAVVVSGERNIPALSPNNEILPRSCTGKTENRAVSEAGTRRSYKRRKLSQGTAWQIIDLHSDIAYVRSMPGKAMDPHSLRERERRRAITERMNYLKSIVPGCLEISQQLDVINHVIDYIRHMQDNVMDLSEQIAFSESLSAPYNRGIYDSAPAHMCGASTLSRTRRPSQFSVIPYQKPCSLQYQQTEADLKTMP